MKRLCLPLLLLSLTVSCSNELENEISTATQPNHNATVQATQQEQFPADDGSPRLPYDPADALHHLLLKFDQNKALVMGETEITEAEMQEIKEFVDQNLKDEAPIKTYRNIFNWITQNIRYAKPNDWPYLKPYEVFKHRVCVCQGFANLLKTMCLTQGIPTIGVNGWLGDIGGHAWSYVYVDNQWYVSDPTNKKDYPMSELHTYRNWLMPFRTDLCLFEDENFGYNFEDRMLNVAVVKPTGKHSLTVPYSVAGYRITSFCPQQKVNPSFTELYLGKNIECFGNNPSIVAQNFPSLETIFLEKGSPRLEAYKSVLYIDGNNSPYFIPPAIRRIELRPMKAVEKNTLYDLPSVEEVVVAPGTERIEAYAFERCPNLLRVYVPLSVKYIDRQAAYNCNDHVEFIKEQTGITEVTR